MKLKHGDRVKTKSGHNEYLATIEERFISKSPSKKQALFIVFDFPRTPIEVKDYLKFYGTIQAITESPNQ